MIALNTERNHWNSVDQSSCQSLSLSTSWESSATINAKYARISVWRCQNNLWGNLCATISVCGLGCHRASMSSALHLGLELRLLETSLRHAEPLTNTPAFICARKIPHVIKSRSQRAETETRRRYPRLKRAAWLLCACMQYEGMCVEGGTWPRYASYWRTGLRVYVHATAHKVQ